MGNSRILDDATRAQLRYTTTVRSGIDLRDFPDFLIVGPQRTGTTWLHANLREHPEVLMSEPKEIFFFSRLKTPEHPGYQSNDLEWYLKLFRYPLWRTLLKHGTSLRRYGEFFRPRVRGEATASYAALDPDIIVNHVTDLAQAWKFPARPDIALEDEISKILQRH